MYLLRQTIKPSCTFCNFILIKDTMKKLFLTIIAALAGTGVFAQTADVQAAAAEAAQAMSAAPEVGAKVEKQNNWTTSLKTQINVGQTGLFNWAAGGDNTVSLAAFIDGNANWKKGDMFWNNRLQLDYGFLYASSKPLLQKSTDRIYLESKWGYKAPSTKHLYFSANYDFKSQFSTGYDYKTPSKLTDDNGNDLVGSDLRQAWRDARVLKSNFLAPAYTNIALGLDYVPTKWLSVNFAPLTGGLVIVRDKALWESYTMGGKPVKFEFGAQLKLDAKVNVNDNFAYSTQVVLFANYLDIKRCPRINWDNRIDWKLAKYFSLTITTTLIYDDTIMIISDKDVDKYPNGKARVQFKESLAFGFTYTIANKK